MTYIIGINKKDYKFTAIISDIMLSYNYLNNIIYRENTALKTGLLFKGCIYGICGDWNASRAFLSSFKRNIDKTKDINGKFEELNKYIKSKHWEEGKGFKILFSLRNPDPQFYIFNSEEAELKLCNESLITLGSGKELLDKLVLGSKVILNKFIMRKLKEHKAGIVYYPCFLCLWLMERILGEEQAILAKAGVGGVFHFCYQTPTKECPAGPLVYVVSRLSNDESKLEYKTYRTLFINGFLIVDLLQEKKRFIISSDVERPDLSVMGDNEKQHLIREINNYCNKQPLYYFCGFGIHDYKHRGYYTGHFSCTKEKVIDQDGNIKKGFQEKIFRNIKSGKADF